MALLRENVLTLIGSRRYHSCILTTFSFDFYFFEMKAMKWLRSCGIRNINVFIDGYYYSELLQQATGDEMQLNPGYSIYPVFQKSIFHPKIWLLFGEKEGLLIVGSGNLTDSGNGNNDEIWGAFHFDIRSTENAPIFAAAWNYASMLSSSVKGQMSEKTTKWITGYSKWLNELPRVKPFQFSDTSKKEEVAFLFNSETSSILEELVKLMRNEKVVEITTISPFYDRNGKALQELKTRFPGAKINVVLDESGLIPSSMPISKEFIFYDWYDAGVSKTQYSKSDNSKSKLHGKIIHFKTRNGEEFCLFGSANVTPEGLGLAGGKNSNAEVSLLIHSKNGGLIDELGIKLKSTNSKSLSEFRPTTSQSIYQTVIKNNQFKVRLLAAELIYDELTLFSSGNHSGQFKVVFFDKQNKCIGSQKATAFAEELKIKLVTTLTGLLYVQFADAKDEVISNKLLISDYFFLAKTHPNPKAEDIERIYSDIQAGDLSKVLDLLHYAIFDETENDGGPIGVLSSKNQEAKRTEKKDPEKLYDLSTYKLIENRGFEKNILLSSLSLRVLDILKFIHAKALLSNKPEDIRVDEQEENIGNISGNEENEVKVVHNLSHSLLKTNRKKLLNYFDSLYSFQQEILYGNNKIASYKLTLTDVTKYLIALELILEYGGKTEKYDDQDKQYYFDYLPFSGDYYNDNAKGCCLNLIGDFLMLARMGFKDYEFDYTKNKVEQLKTEALIITIVCLLNTRWRGEELPYLYTMLLNALHYLGWKDVNGFDSNFVDLKKGIAKRISELKYRATTLEEVKGRFYKNICPAFRTVIKNRENKKFDTTAKQGQFIYSSIVGYCLVHSVSKTNDFTLIRPGFLWDDEKEDYLRHRADEIYSPLKLPSFICVNL